MKNYDLADQKGEKPQIDVFKYRAQIGDYGDRLAALIPQQQKLGFVGILHFPKLTRDINDAIVYLQRSAERKILAINKAAEQLEEKMPFPKHPGAEKIEEICLKLRGGREMTYQEALELPILNEFGDEDQ